MTGYREVLEHPYWRHRIPLGGGKYTPGTKDETHWQALGMPEDLSGKSFMDIGAFDGLHSFEAERRGSEDVLATDVWSEPKHDCGWWNSLRPGKQGFNIVHDFLGSEVDSMTIAAEDVSVDRTGSYDLVLCAGVVYHLKEPYTAVENAVSVADERVVIESAVTEDLDEPGMKFLRGSELDDNPSNYWMPNLGALKGMVEEAGAEETEAHLMPVKEEESDLPGLCYGKIEDGGVYESPALEDSIGTVRDREATWLMDYGGASRVEYRDGEAKVQGWVPVDSFQEDCSMDLSEDTARGVVHGFL